MIIWKVRTRGLGALIILYCLFVGAASGMGCAQKSIVLGVFNYAFFIYFISGIGILLLNRWARYYAIAFLFISLVAGLCFYLENMTPPWILLFFPLLCTVYLLLPEVRILFKKNRKE